MSRLLALLRRNGIELAALVLGCALALATAATISVTTDEPKHLVNGLHFAQTGHCCLHDEPPLAIVHAWALQRDLAAADTLRPEQLYAPPDASRSWLAFAPRLPTCLAFALLILVAWRWSRELFPAASSWVPVVLCAFCPTLLAHGSVCTEDMFLTTSAFYAFYRLYRYLRQPTRHAALVVGIAMGLVYLSKASSPVVHVTLLTAWFLAATRRPIRAQLRRRDWLLDGLAIVLLPLLILNAGYLFVGFGGTLRELGPASPQMKELANTPLGAIPLPLPRGFLHAIDFSRYDIGYRALTGNDYYLFGETHRTGHKYYFIVAFLLKTSTLELLLGGAGIVAWLRSPRREPADITLWLFPLVFLAFNCSQNVFHIGVRYLLPIYPFLLVMAGFACRRLEDARWRVAAVVPAALAIVQFPNYIGYFNVSSLVRTKADMLVDSNLDWGQLNYLVEADQATAPSPGGWVMPPHLWGGGGEWPRPTIHAGTFYVTPTTRQLVRQPWTSFLRDPEPTRKLGDTIEVYEIRTEDQFALGFVDDWWTSDVLDNPAFEPGSRLPSVDALRELATTRLTHRIRVAFGHLEMPKDSTNRCFLARPASPLRGEVLYSADDVAYVYDEDFRIVDIDRSASPAVLPERSFAATEPHSYLFLVCNLTGEGGLVVATRR